MLYYIRLSLKCICKVYYDYKQCLERLEDERKFYDKKNNKYQFQEKSFEAMLAKGLTCSYSCLCDMMVKGWAYFSLLITLSTLYSLTALQYSYCSTYALASLWVFAPNCRAQSVEHLTKRDFEFMENSDEHSVYDLSRHFKSVQKHTYQLVFGTDIAKMFVRYIRPTAIKPEVDSSNSTLFPTFEGHPLAQGEVNKKIRRFFARWGFDLNITAIRKTVAAYMKSLEEKKQISAEGNTYYLIYYNR